MPMMAITGLAQPQRDFRDATGDSMTVPAATGLVVLAFALAAAGGAVIGARIGGKYLGKDLAAMMGALFGPAAVVPATVVGLLLLGLLK
jgi:hypothetical protein